MSYLKFIVIIFLFFISQKVFSRNITASFFPPQIKIIHPKWEDTIVHTENNRFCRTMNRDCGKVEDYSSTRFTLKWDKHAPEVFEKKDNKEHFSLKIPIEEIPAPSLPDWSNRRFLIDNQIVSYKLDRRGRMYNKEGRYMGQILSDNILKKKEDEIKHILKENIIILNAEGNKQVWTKNKNGIYELSKIDLKNGFQYRILVFMPSFKRPVFLSGQILRIMRQTYDNFDFFVSVKGVSQDVIEETVMLEWHEYIKSGRLHVRFDPNKKQLANMLDPIRDVDISKYDYFCKIDDDDWYSPTYLENIVDHLNTGEDIFLTGSPTYYEAKSSLKSVNFNYTNQGWGGGSMCYNKEVMKALFEIEKMTKDQIRERYKLIYPVEWYLTGHEDALIALIASQTGTVLRRDYIVPNVIYNQQYPSISRNENYTQN